MMFVLNLVNELGFHFRGHIHADSSSARSIATRKGVGKVKHLEIRSLHVQDFVQWKFFVIHKIKGEENPADLGTKFLTWQKIFDLCKGSTCTLITRTSRRSCRTRA